MRWLLVCASVPGKRDVRSMIYLASAGTVRYTRRQSLHLPKRSGVLSEGVWYHLVMSLLSMFLDAVERPSSKPCWKLQQLFSTTCQSLGHAHFSLGMQWSLCVISYVQMYFHLEFPGFLRLRLREAKASALGFRPQCHRTTLGRHSTQELVSSLCI